MKFTYSLFLILLVNTLATAQITQARMDSLDRQRIAYIATFKDLAILEMYKSGIPASITLAQGLLETGAGTSLLAVNANNHFGMKCGDRWDGKTMYKNDDEFDRNGQLVKSCFRAYDDPAENFADHSNFLRDPQKYNRYGGLFLIDPLDYVAWGTGLQAAGYSPVGHYSARLIEHIERYHLHEIDYRAWDERWKVSPPQRIVEVNNTQMVRAFEGETPADIAKFCGVDMASILSYNDLHWDMQSQLAHGTPIFIEEKKERWEATNLEFYFSQDGKNIFEIGQLFGIKEAKLRSMNGINDLQEPAYKSKVRVSGQRNASDNMTIATTAIKSPVAQKPRNKKPPMVPQQSNFPVNRTNVAQLTQVLGTPFTLSADISAPKSSRGVTVSAPPVINEEVAYVERTVASLIFHEVAKGDTLMSISRKYGIPVGDIRKYNSISNDQIQIGQRLRVK